MTTSSQSIRDLIHRARRRFFFNVALAQAVLAASVAMGGAILILVAGAQFLDWRWVAALAAVTFPLAYFRTARRVPPPYRVAQIVDGRLNLADSLSTALYFSDLAEPGRAAEPVRQAQLAESERLTAQVDPAIAVPLAAPRSLYALGALFLVAATLFGLRYGVQRRLDLDRPLVSLLIDAFGGERFEQRASVKKTRKTTIDIWGQTAVDTMAGPESQYKDMGVDLKGQEWMDENPQGGQSSEIPEANFGDDQQSPDSNKSDGSNARGDGAGKESEGADADEGAPNSNKESPSGGAQDAKQSGSQQNSPSDSSLASKIKDALSSLMASMRKPNSPQQNSGQSGDSKGQQQSKGAQQKAQGEGQKSNGENSSAEDAGQAGDEGQSEQMADAKGPNSGTEGAPNGDKGSGMGKQDGAKEARLAAQLAAMGKISEIIGQRSQNVTGEVTIEVTSSKQPLRTPYAENKAAHAEAPGDINRDEVPPAFQEYVQQYFEQVRKPAKPAPAPGKPAQQQ